MHMKENITKVETIEEMVIRLPEDFAEPGEKVSVSHRDDGSILISKMISIPIDIDKETLFELSMEAHERDITLNELCIEILRWGMTTLLPKQQRNLKKNKLHGQKKGSAR